MAAQSPSAMAALIIESPAPPVSAQGGCDASIASALRWGVFLMNGPFYWGSALIRSVQYSPAVAGSSPCGSRAAILSVPCPYRLTVLATLGWLPRSRAGHPCLDLSQPVVRVRAGTQIGRAS